ncbi:hypothetical protein CEXT_594941 [Caerostris extrusa]|uniref:Uncharacterized protein n=1 Tax=Caerostris extrusa TaxID=172846 RepID=A0AAV4W803_CAEEX|nr:hypothetical protein CEXT_594941 [Caerostris extrusa]
MYLLPECHWPSKTDQTELGVPKGFSSNRTKNGNSTDSSFFLTLPSTNQRINKTEVFFSIIASIESYCNALGLPYAGTLVDFSTHWRSTD